MARGQLALAELNRHDWSQFRCGCLGTAEHVPDIFRAIVQAEGSEKVYGILLEGHLEVQGNLFEVAVPATGVILAALSGDLSAFSRALLMESLWRLVTGDSHHTEMVLGRSHLGDECRLKAREGYWIILQQGFGKHTDEALDILEMIDLDEARLGYYSNSLKSRKVRR